MSEASEQSCDDACRDGSEALYHGAPCSAASGYAVLTSACAEYRVHDYAYIKYQVSFFSIATRGGWVQDMQMQAMHITRMSN